MARTRDEEDDAGPAKPRPDVYVGMLAMAAASMVVGVGLLALEAGDYDWESQPAAVRQAPLPGPLPPKPTG